MMKTLKSNTSEFLPYDWDQAKNGAAIATKGGQLAKRIIEKDPNKDYILVYLDSAYPEVYYKETGIPVFSDTPDAGLRILKNGTQDITEITPDDLKVKIKKKIYKKIVKDLSGIYESVDLYDYVEKLKKKLDKLNNPKPEEHEYEH